MSGEFLSPKIRDIEVNLTLSAGGSSTSVAAVAVRAVKGPVGTPILISNIDQYITTFGKPLIKDTNTFTAMAFLSKGSQLWVTRYLEATATFASSILSVAELVVTVESGDNTAVGQMEALAILTDSSPSNVTADPGIVWASSDEAIATVTAVGVVTGIADGAATISATINGVTASAVFTVDIP